MKSLKRSFFAPVAVLALGAVSTQAQAGYTTVDLSSVVNEGFTNAWFINGGDFSGLDGTTSTGNQGSSIPFYVANPSDGNGNTNNFWYGLYSGPGTLSGPPGNFTINVAGAGTSTVYTLIDNTFGTTSAQEYSVTFTGTGGSITDNYVGGNNTKDYNLNCGTTGCLSTPNASYWFIDPNSSSQWLQVTSWSLPANFGLQSISFNQLNGSDGAIVAGITLGTAAVPEPASWVLMLTGFGLAGVALRQRGRTQRTA
ncbi:MAG: PEP-CTERM sorting domain-containing protein [Sphingomonadales bacterium]|nr:PEP-CTERM sorting domain-containing protein [Sphingomonadales bacterium]